MWESQVMATHLTKIKSIDCFIANSTWIYLVILKKRKLSLLSKYLESSAEKNVDRTENGTRKHL